MKGYDQYQKELEIVASYIQRKIPQDRRPTLTEIKSLIDSLVKDAFDKLKIEVDV